MRAFVAGPSVIGMYQWMLFWIFLVVWVVVAFWPARVARRKGHSFIGYFVLSLIFFPLALILAYAVHDRRGSHIVDAGA